MTVASGWLVPKRERTLRAAEVAEVTTKIGAQAGQTPYYDVVLVTTSGKRVTAGGGIRDKREAEWLAATMHGGDSGPAERLSAGRRQVAAGHDRAHVGGGSMDVDEVLDPVAGSGDRQVGVGAASPLPPTLSIL